MPGLISKPAFHHNVRRSQVSEETIQDCEAADNCEVYEGEYGTAVRFKSGMEPASAVGKAHLARRNDLAPRQLELRTRVTVGNNKIDFGKIGAPAAYSRLRDVCTESACNPEPFPITSWTSNAEGNSVPYEYTLNLIAEGQYASLEDRDKFIQAIQDASGVEEKCEERHWMKGGVGGMGGSPTAGTITSCTQTNFINVNRFEGKSDFQGFMNARFEVKKGDNSFCAAASTFLAAITAVIGIIPAGAGVAAAGAGFFGAVTATCSVN